jgi:hypothetical protein
VLLESFALTGDPSLQGAGDSPDTQSSSHHTRDSCIEGSTGEGEDIDGY